MATRLLFLSLLAVFALILAWGSGSRAIGVDFYQFWIVAESLDRPGVNIYSEETRSTLGKEFLEKSRETGNPQLISIAEYRQKLETYSSPFLYSLFRRFSTGHYDVDLCNYRLLLLACLTSSVILLARLFGHSWDIALAAVAIFAAWSAPFASDMRVANVNSLQLAAIALYLWATLRTRWRYRDIVGGAILGLAIAFKPNLIFIPAMLTMAWILSGRMKRLSHFVIGAVVGAALAVAMAAISFGSLHCWADWIVAIRTLPTEIISVQAGNFAPVRMLNEWLKINSAIPVAIVFLTMSILPLWLSRRGVAEYSDGTRDVLAVCLGCLLVVLAPALAWLHYYVLIIPVILFVTSPIYPAGQRFVLLRYLLIGLAILGYAFDALGYLALMPPPRIESILVVVPTLILFGLTILDFSRSRPATSENRQSLSAPVPQD